MGEINVEINVGEGSEFRTRVMSVDRDFSALKSLLEVFEAGVRSGVCMAGRMILVAAGVSQSRDTAKAAACR